MNSKTQQLPDAGDYGDDGDDDDDAGTDAGDNSATSNTNYRDMETQFMGGELDEVGDDNNDDR